jgi:enoyl-CoA hydratase
MPVVTAESPPLRTERAGDTLHLTLTRPAKANALSAAMVDALATALDEAAEGGVRLLVLRGEGRHFCAGFDFEGLDTQSDGDLLLRFVRIEQLLQKLHHAPFATLALAQGRAMGAGADLFAACTTRIATRDTSFAFPGAAFGLILGTRRLVRRVGAERARAWIASGEVLAADAAADAGLVSTVADLAKWPDLIAMHAKTSARLDGETRCLLHTCTVTDSRAEDLAALTISAARPGLRARILAYREAAARR